jgi:hypothetical protein
MHRYTFMVLALAACIAQGGGSAAAAEERNDLREFRIGMKVDELPKSGYLGFSCAAEPEHELSGWQDYRQCPTTEEGFREVRFRYDGSANPLGKVNDAYEGTRVGGHPVLVSVLFSDSGTVAGIHIETDPKARLYLHKKAFLLGLQAKARYGEDGWVCSEGQPSANQQPVGGVFVQEHCEKTAQDRHIVVERDLFRDPAKDLKQFVDDTRITILQSD